MRVPPQERRQFRVRGWMVAVVVVLLILLFSLRGLAGFYTDYLWFDSLEQGGTWSSLLGARVVPALVFTVVFFLLLLANLLVADRLAPKARGLGPQTPEDELVVRYQQSTARYQGRIRVAVALFFAFIAGIGVSAQWREWILFTNRVDFGVDDPQFHRDVGFYMFELPFLKFMIDWLFAGLVIVLLVTAVAHYLNGGIRFQSPLQRVTPQVKAHISVILAVMALVKTADYYFSRFDLAFSDRGAVDGATYTDVNAQLPAFEFLIVVSGIAALLFLWNIWRRGWVLPVIAVGLWGFISLIVGTIYPAAIQNFKVKPNELANERKFIARNIDATRAAFGLDDVDSERFDFTVLTPEAVSNNLTTIDNARLWDPATIEPPYQTLQEFQAYYRITDVDVDRYTVDGPGGQQVRQVMIAARDLNSAGLPNRSWVNEHVVFTHGYGVVASPANEAAGNGDPSYFVSDVPTTENGIALEGRAAEVYFGENLSEYVIVGGKQREFNFARERGGDAQTRYEGRDGVKVSNILRRAAFALRFGDPNPLISGQVTGDSKVLMIRDVRERAEKLAPFLEFDDDPYPVVVDDKLLWVLDGYTTSDRYPYSQLASGGGGLSVDFNYVRNSVKVTIDAYDGTVRYYVIDEEDPLIRAYSKAFPDLFTSGDRMPEAVREHLRYPEDPLIRAYGKAFPDLFTPGDRMPEAVREHLRYPEDLFQVQSDVYAKYHVTDARRFYRQNDRWLRSPDPVEASDIVESTPGGARRGAGRTPEITSSTKRQDPFYLYIRLPGDDRESFVLLQPFVPVSGGDQQLRLSSFLTVKSDPRNYGKLEAFVMPTGEQVQGPVQVAASIQAEESLSEQFTLLSRGGSRVVFGNIQLIPVGGSIVYIQPVYVQRETRGYPQFAFAVAFTEDSEPVFGETVSQAVGRLVGLEETDGPTQPEEPAEPGGRTPEQLLADAAQRFADADAALRSGDLAEYERLEQEGRDLVEQALRLLRDQEADAESTPSPTTTTTAPTQEAAAREASAR